MSSKLTYEELQKRVVELRETTARANELYISLFENSHSIMLIICPESGKIIDANTAACNFYGYGKDEIKSLKVMDINILSHEEIYTEMQNAKCEKRKYFNFQHRLANGDIRDVEVFSGPIILDGKKVLYSIIHDISERKKIEREKEELISKLEQAFAEIKILKGILPICASCKKILDDKGAWKQIESYIRDHSEVEFSHGICPECAKKLYPELYPPDSG